MENKLIAWNVINHTSKFEGSLVGYHCPECGQAYMIAKYTIEGIDIETNQKYTLCHKEKTLCCNEKLSTPLSFFDALKAKQFISNPKKLRDTNIEKTKCLEITHFKNDSILN